MGHKNDKKRVIFTRSSVRENAGIGVQDIREREKKPVTPQQTSSLNKFTRSRPGSQTSLFCQVRHEKLF